MTFTIHRAKPPDAAALVELNEEFNGLQVPLAVVEKRLSKTGKGTAFLARAGRTAVGYACVQYCCSFCYPRPWAEVTEMYVRPRYRRKGVAAALLAAVEKEARRRGVDQIIVLTGESNTRGQCLYSSAGYRGKRKYVYKKSLINKSLQPTAQTGRRG